MIGAFNKIVKRLVGDKAATDVQAIQPAIDAIKSHEAEMQSLTADGLRERSRDLRKRILGHVQGLVAQSDELKAQVAANPTMSQPFEAGLSLVLLCLVHSIFKCRGTIGAACATAGQRNDNSRKSAPAGYVQWPRLS